MGEPAAGHLATIRQAGRVFVYLGTPALGTLVASHCPAGPAVDVYGNSCPAGDWCADGYNLVNMTEVWPGTMLVKVPPQGHHERHDG